MSEEEKQKKKEYMTEYRENYPSNILKRIKNTIT